MNLKLLDGKVVKTMALEGLKKLVNEIERPLGLTVIQVGDNASSNIYIKQKRKMAEFLGFNFNHIKLEDDVTLEGILRIIDELNNDEEVDGILVQMPVSEHLDSKVIQNAINPLKDVDGLTDINMGKLVHKKECLVPCTALGIMELLNYYNIPVISKNVVVVGRSDLVGRPVAELLINASATVTLCHSKTKDLASITRGADILIVAVGKSRLITKDMVKDGAVVIDVGINKLEDGSLCGDVDFEEVQKIASYITPVPGGIGPMTIAMLMTNIVKTAK